MFVNKDIVCDESELSIAANNIAEYADFLSRSMVAYVAILSEIQEKGIQDDLVCSKLSSIAESLEPYKLNIKDVCDFILADVNDYIAGVSNVDNFRFPTDITSTITSLVAKFL